MDSLALLNTEITMTSLEVVDLINKFREEEGNRAALKHYDFMKSIRKELESLANAGVEVAERNISVGSYVDKQNQQRPCYKMSRSWVMQMCNKESALVRYKTQQYIEALEQALLDLRFRQGDKIINEVVLWKFGKTLRVMRNYIKLAI